MRFKKNVTVGGTCLLSVAFIIISCSSPSDSDSGEDQDNDSQKTPAYNFAGGDGTPGNPYQIETLEHLDSLSSFSNYPMTLPEDTVEKYMNAHYELVADIDGSATADWNGGKGFNGIGISRHGNTVEDSSISFSGSFNGNEYTISNLIMDRTHHSKEDYVRELGFFDYVNEGRIIDVKLTEISISGKSYVGGLVGLLENGSLEESTVSGTVSAERGGGGVVGRNRALVSNVESSAYVDAKEIAGGLVAENSVGGIIQESVATGDVITKSVGAGGLVSSNRDGTIKSSHATGNVKGSSYVGGLAAYNTDLQFDPIPKIKKSYATGSVTVNTDPPNENTIRAVGGLVGSSSIGTSGVDAIIEGGRAEGNVMAKEGIKIGGLVGHLNGGRVTDSNALGNVSGKDQVGGLVGEVSVNFRDGFSGPDGIVKGSYAEGEVRGIEDVGGLIGLVNDEAKISTSHATGKVSGQEFTGGLVGESWSALDSVYATGNVEGGLKTGGLVGFINEQNITHSYAKGDVSGTNEIGGLVGYMYHPSVISSSYTWGSVTGDENVGGLVGRSNRHDDNEIRRSYSAGEVTGSHNVGGFVGFSGGHEYNSYWDIENSNQDQPLGNEVDSFDSVTDLSTTEMTGSSAKDNMSGFDFENIWATTDGYPVLQWEQE